LFLNYLRFKGIKGSTYQRRILRVTVQRIAWKFEVQRPCGCPISRGFED